MMDLPGLFCPYYAPCRGVGGHGSRAISLNTARISFYYFMKILWATWCLIMFTKSARCLDANFGHFASCITCRIMCIIMCIFERIPSITRTLAVC